MRNLQVPRGKPVKMQRPAKSVSQRRGFAVPEVVSKTCAVRTATPFSSITVTSSLGKGSLEEDCAVTIGVAEMPTTTTPRQRTNPGFHLRMTCLLL
jgi:hypothetical protein